MSDDINFAPSSRSSRTPSQRGDIEYTSGEETSSTPPKKKQPAPPPPAKQPAAHAPQKERSFFAWRKRRQTSTAAVPLNPPPLTAAPHHKKEQTVPDLMHASVDAQLKPKQPALSHLKEVAPNLSSGLPPLQSSPVRAPQHEPTPVEPHAGRTLEEQKKRLVDELPVAEVNLIPEQVLSEFERHNRLRDLGYVGLAMVGVVLLCYGGLNIYQQKITTDTEAVKVDIQNLERQIASYQELQYNAEVLRNRLNSLTEVLTTHIYWTPFLEVVEGVTLPTVYYESMTGSVSTRLFTFDAVAQSYDQIAPQVALLEASPYVSAVEVSGAELFRPESIISETENTTATTEGVQFKLSVQFTADAFFHREN